MNQDKVPNPGSKEAIALGCSCPVSDNGNGLGAYIDKRGHRIFWYNYDCKVHVIDAESKDLYYQLERSRRNG
jgi:hypothetical protein